MKTKSLSLGTWALAGAVTLAVALPAQAASVQLGAANPLEWALLSVGGSTVTINNESIVRDYDQNGNSAGTDSRQIGIQGQGGKLQMSGNGTVAGAARLADGTNIGITGDDVIGGGIYGANLSGDPKGNTVVNVSQDALLNQAAGDAAAYADFYAHLAATNPAITSVTNSLTVNGLSGQNVLNLSTLQLGGGEILTLDGGGNDSSFIVNVFGDLKLNSGHIELAGGLTYDEVLFNVVGGKVAFSGGGNASLLVGTLMALDGEIAISPGLIQGTIIGPKITLTSGADLDTPQVVPVPAALPLFLSALAGMGVVGARRRRAGRSREELFV